MPSLANLADWSDGVGGGWFSWFTVNTAAALVMVTLNIYDEGPVREATKRYVPGKLVLVSAIIDVSALAPAVNVRLLGNRMLASLFVFAKTVDTVTVSG